MKTTIEIYTNGRMTIFHNVPLKVAKAVITILSEVENDESEVFSSVREVEHDK